MRPHSRPDLIMLILVRHGESVANAQGLLLGRTDAELTATGRAQAETARALVYDPVAEVRSSPLRRALHTAELLALGPAVAVDERWIEVDYGEFEGERLGAIPAEVWQRWQRDRDFRPEGGETLAEVDRRVAATCEELFAVDGAGARRSDGDVVVVSHVSPIKAAVAWALGTVDLYWRLHLRTASVTRIGWSRDAPILHGFNEVSAVDPTMPDDQPTLAALRPPPGSGEEPVHRRTITMEVFQRDEYFAVVGTLHDERPWASGEYSPRQLHFMDLGLVVRRADMTIVDAAADMQTFPHAECTDIEPHFRDLIGLSVARGLLQRSAGALRSSARLQSSGIPGPGHGSRGRAGHHLIGRLGGRKGQRRAPGSRGRLYLLDQHVSRLDRGRAGCAEDRARLASGRSWLSGARRRRRAPAHETSSPKTDYNDGAGTFTGACTELLEHEGHDPSRPAYGDARGRSQALPGLPRRPGVHGVEGVGIGRSPAGRPIRQRRWP